MAWYNGGDWAELDDAANGPTIAAEIETALRERENMLFGLSESAVAASYFDGYSLSYPGVGDEETVRDWVVTARLRIARLLATTMIFESTAPATTGTIKFGVFTNAAKTKIFSLGGSTSGFENLWASTAYSDWIALSSAAFPRLAVFEQLRDVLDLMVNVAWNIAPDIADRTVGMYSNADEEALWDYYRGASGLPGGSTFDGNRLYYGYNQSLPTFLNKGEMHAGVWSVSVNQALVHEADDLDLGVGRVVGTHEGGYLAMRRLRESTGTWPTTSHSLTVAGVTQTITSSGSPSTLDSLTETDMGDTWPDLSGETMSFSLTTPPADIPLGSGSFGSSEHFVRWFFHPKGDGTFYNSETLSGTRVHTDITGELTYG